MSSLVKALKKKFKSPKDVLVALGMDASALDADEKAALGIENSSNLVIGDSDKEIRDMAKNLPTKRAAINAAALAHYLNPLIAQDAKPVTAVDLLPAFNGVTGKNWKAKHKDIIAEIAKVLKPHLAQDAASPDDVILRLVEMLPGAGGGGEPEGEEGIDASVSPEQNAAMGAAANVEMPKKVGEESMENGEKAAPPAPGGGSVSPEICDFLLSKGVDPSVIEELKSQFGGGAAGDDDSVVESVIPGKEKEVNPNSPSPAPTSGKEAGHHMTGDEPANFKGMPEVGNGPGGKVPSAITAKDGKHAMDEKVTKQAMDAAISAAVTAAAAKATQVAKEIRDAEKAVRPYIGELAVAFDSAEGVYRHALKAMGFKEADSIHASALPSLLKIVPAPGSKKPETRIAMDEASSKSFFDRNPGAARLKVIG